jgi:DNA-directed RNA polymerase specialized sigma24 family protein
MSADQITMSELRRAVLAHRDVIATRCQRAGWPERVAEIEEACVERLRVRLAAWQDAPDSRDFAQWAGEHVVNPVLDEMDAARCEDLRRAVETHRPWVASHLVGSGSERDIDDVLTAGVSCAWQSMGRWGASHYDENLVAWCAVIMREVLSRHRDGEAAKTHRIAALRAVAADVGEFADFISDDEVGPDPVFEEVMGRMIHPPADQTPLAAALATFESMVLSHPGGAVRLAKLRARILEPRRGARLRAQTAEVLKTIAAGEIVAVPDSLAGLVFGATGTDRR